MISQKNFKKYTTEYFRYLVEQFNFNKPVLSSNGNVFFDMTYKNENITISISYEVIEDYIQIFILNEGKERSLNYFGSSKIINLKSLRTLIIPKLNQEKIADCKTKFSQFSTYDEFTKKLLKEAKDLYLCLEALGVT